MATDAAAYWDEQAVTFDDQPDHGLRHPGVRAAWERLLLPLLPSAPAVVADLGCGTGSLTVLLTSAGYDVVGLDLAPRMVAAARAKVRGAGMSARFVIGDAAAPALATGRFDVVLARHVLWAMPDVHEALRRWVRLLRPGGRLALVEGRWHTGAGITATEAERAVLAHRAQAEVRLLNEPGLWGGPITDERYLLVSNE